MRFIIMRHGQTDWNYMRKIQGVSDIPLNDIGRLQAKAAADHLEKFYAVQAVYSSPLSRAYETAQICATPFSLPVQKTDELLELKLGDWEGLTFQEIGQLYPTELQQWESEPHLCQIPGDSEMIELLWERLDVFLDRLKELHGPKNETVLCVTHHMPARIILAQHLGLPIENMRTLRVKNATLNVIEWCPEKTVISTLNERVIDMLQEDHW